MKNFIVVPHSCIGPIQLRASPDEVRKNIGDPEITEEAHEKWGIEFPAKDYFFEASLQVSYDREMKVDCIVAAQHVSYRVIFDGVVVHDLPVVDMISVVRRYCEPDRADEEYPVNQIFKKLDLTLYREHSEKKRFTAIGIGIKDYTKNIHSNPG